MGIALKNFQCSVVGFQLCNVSLQKTCATSYALIYSNKCTKNQSKGNN